MIHVCKNPEMGGGFHFLAHGLYNSWSEGKGEYLGGWFTIWRVRVKVIRVRVMASTTVGRTQNFSGNYFGFIYLQVCFV